MRNIVRGILFVGGGLCFFAAMMFFGFLALSYVSGGAGIEFAGLSVTPGGVLIGTIPFAGFCIIAGLCFLIGVTLCAHGVVPPMRVGVPLDVRAFRFVCRTLRPKKCEPDFRPRCVRCGSIPEGRPHICPYCEWPQPHA